MLFFAIYYSYYYASTRQRILQMVPYLAQENIGIDIQPLFDNAYLEMLFKHGKRNSLNILRAYAKRALGLLRCRHYDFVWVQYELFPYLPLEAIARFIDKPILYDCDDAIFHQYDQHPRAIVRTLLGNKLVPLLQQCKLAFCGNAYLEAYVRNYCGQTEIIPTTVDSHIFVPQAKTTKTSRPVLGWIGSPSTWNYCLPLIDLFSEFVAADSLEMLVIGAGHNAKNPKDFTFREWQEQCEVADIQQMDIGIMPMPDAPWARGKCGYKLIQYMACGLPVIASPVGVNRDIVEHGVNGFLASTKEQWRQAIELLTADGDLRQRMGQAGRAKIEKHYSIQVQGPRVAKLIHALLSQD